MLRCFCSDAHFVTKNYLAQRHCGLIKNPFIDERKVYLFVLKMAVKSHLALSWIWIHTKGLTLSVRLTMVEVGFS